MRRLLSVVLLAAVAIAGASEVRYGNFEVAFGKVRQADGTMKDITGMKFPYRAERIEAKKVSAVEAFKRRFQIPGFTAARTGTPVIDHWARGGFQRFGPEALQKVYQNDSGGLYAILDPAEWEDPSSLDDMTMISSGVDKPWKQLTMGFHWDGSNTARIIIRWRIWTTNIDLPEGMNDFINEIGDFGGYFQWPLQGTWKVTFGIAQAGVASPTQTVYMAQQFRTDQPNGEGPFRADYRNVYSNASPPQIGTSLNQWWYDWEGGADGIYENTEIEVLPDGFSNMLYTIEIDTASNMFTAVPTAVVPTKGSIKSGDTLSLWYDGDNDALRFAEPRVDRLQNPVAMLEVASRLASSSISSFTIQTSARATRLGAYYRIQLYRYSGTPGWVDIGGVNNLTTFFQPIQFTYGGTIPLTEFLNGNRDVRVRLRFYRAVTAGPVSQIEYYVDKVNWRYASP